MTLNRAFSDLEIRSVDEEKRIIRGWATRPFLDRVNDRIDPLGCTFRNPCTMLLQHLHDKPVGTVVFDRPTREGVAFTAQIPKIAEPGILQDRTDEAYQSAKAKILRHVSIGFRPTKPPTPNAEGGLDWPAIEIYELSLVSVPALPEAEILEVRGNRARAVNRSPVVRLSEVQRRKLPVVRLDPVTRHRLAGTLKIHTAPRNRPGAPFKIRKIHTPPRPVKLSLPPKSAEPRKAHSVVKLTPEDIARAERRAKTRVVKLGRR